MEKLGIEETEKLIFILSNNILELFTVDFEKVIEELDDIDEKERQQLLIDIAEASIDIMLKISLYGLKTGLELFSKK